MDGGIKLSVIIPLYNQQELVKIGLDSVPKRDDIEIIVVDDGSTDDSYNVVEKYREETGKNITLLRNERNRGVGYTVNRGLDIAKGEYIAQLDSDGDYLVGLERAIAFLDFWDIIYFPFQINDGTWKQTEILDIGHFPGCSKFVRREFIGDLREPHLENEEDTYFYNSLRAKNPTEKLLGKEIVYLHYNYPREGSNVWNVLHGITPKGMVRE